MSDESSSLYQKRIPIFTRTVKGTFRTFKSSVLYLAYLVFFLLPWIPWDRPFGAKQAVLFDIVGRRYYLFGLVVDIQNIFWLAGILAIFAFTLFFVTSILGRVFCGYFCFQTLWTDAFMKIEALVAGNRNARQRLHDAPWTSTKIIKISSIWGLWLLFAFWSGFTFTAYWSYAPQLLVDFFTGNAAFAAYGCTLFITIATFVMAGFAREQVCAFMCPYARFQGVMFDKDTLVVAYDERRGEGEKGRAKPIKELRDLETRRAAGVGDCVDCDLCVQVCPAGIDIRDGLNYRCITCGLCIDACNTMMTKTGFPTGLIRYDSENGLAGKKTHYLKPRNIGYGAVILIFTGILLWSVFSSDSATFSVERTRVPAFTQLSDGQIQNKYEIKLNNLTIKPQIVSVSIEHIEHADFVMRFNNYHLKPGQRIDLPVFIRQAPNVAKDSPVTFLIKVTDEAGVLIENHTIESTFVAK